jgi:adenosylmethionine-8-amino-7-oxononanoate aminotransferase
MSVSSLPHLRAVLMMAAQGGGMPMTDVAAATVATQLADLDRAHIVHPNLPSSVAERTVFVRGQGARLWDAEGREYLDATGGLWLTQIGHGRREIAEVAAAQIERLEYFTSFWDFSNDQAIRLAARLASLAPDGLDRVFFTNGGSEGNETAIKAARLYHHERGEPERTWILSRRDAYHGLGYGSGSATGFDVYHHGFGPLVPDVEHLTPAWPYRTELFGGADPTDFLLAEMEAAIERIGPGRVAAMIGEPIMGVAGAILPPDDYWPRVRELLSAHGILLIADEVVTGFGRTGVWFASESYGMRPDLVVTAKGLTSGYAPLGAVLMRGEIADAITAGDHGFPHGFTYNGHPVCCAIAMENLAILEREELLPRAREMGDAIAERVAPLAQLPVVGEIRHRGMMLGIELVADRERRTPLPIHGLGILDVIRAETGVIMRDVGHTVVCSPPLVLTEEQADRLADALASVLERLQPDGTVRG